MGEDRTGPYLRSTTVAEAAEILGISAEAVRSRIKRHTLPTVREQGAVDVVLREGDRARPTTDQVRQGGDRPTDWADALLEELRDRIGYLERQVEQEREARRRADMLLAQLVQRIPELEAPQPKAPTAAPEPPPAATEQPGRVEPQPQVEGAQEGAEHVSWWRRMFGG